MKILGRMFGLAAALLLLSLSGISSLHAQGGAIELLLSQIVQNTSGILEKVNNLPTYLQELTEAALSWLAPDTSETTANMQANFANWTNLSLANQTAQASLLLSLEQSFFGSSITPTTLPYANDLTYSTLLGTLYFDPDPRTKGNKQPPDSALNYLKNAASLNVSHILPSGAWQGPQYSQTRYINFYNTIAAVQTYNAYALSEVYTKSKDNSLSQLQTTLLTQASNSSWFSEVASENIGIHKCMSC